MPLPVCGATDARRPRPTRPLRTCPFLCDRRVISRCRWSAVTAKKRRKSTKTRTFISTCVEWMEYIFPFDFSRTDRPCAVLCPGAVSLSPQHSLSCCSQHNRGKAARKRSWKIIPRWGEKNYLHRTFAIKGKDRGQGHRDRMGMLPVNAIRSRPSTRGTFVTWREIKLPFELCALGAQRCTTQGSRQTPWLLLRETHRSDITFRWSASRDGKGK